MKGLSQDILGFLDRMDGVTIKGWAVDKAAPHEELQLRIIIDNAIVDVIDCSLQRDDVAALELPIDTIGFSYSVPLTYQDGNRHVLRFASISGTPVVMATKTGMAMPEIYFCLLRQTHLESFVDGLVDGAVQGWALNIDKRTEKKTGGVRILVALAGQPIAELLANQFRADVAVAFQTDVACGFSFSPPPELRHGRHVSLSFHALPGHLELLNSPVKVWIPGDAERQRIDALIARADELFSFAYHLRRELKAALPAERYSLSDYSRWAARSLPLAGQRAVAKYGGLPSTVPLVSIVCPVYRPVIGAFLAVVDSVRGQSYRNWELLLVDDGSLNADLTEVMKSLAKVEPRIRLLRLLKNSGISRASNCGIKHAEGRFIAFLDHDDVLHHDALDIMLRAQMATGARLLYSDEDKIDFSGGLSEPHFKPDFNYRFLLELNYICHFVFMDMELMKSLGGLNPAYDGAQDHDLLLRATELISPAEIHHVAEVLYHWRKSASSSAASATAKPEAAHAGRRAVKAHLQRRKLKANVTLRGDQPCYKITWDTKNIVKKPLGVSILIPFRDHIDITRACVEAVRKYTRTIKYEIILMDNWSASAAAEVFCAEQASLPDTTVIRITEEFNYSRINNVGAKASSYDFILFLNNDVFVKSMDWLDTMLNECLINDKVGAVGAKLLYQNGTVQHAGVVLGIGGIADHAFRGLPGDAPGYVMRANVNQQISAVTAACMLVRKDAFEGVDGFDEADLKIAFNDVDLCINFTKAGWQIIYTPDVVAEHRESMSRGDDLEENKIARFMLENETMRQRHKDALSYDPFYNQHFSRDGGVYRELRLLGSGLSD